MLRAAAAVDQVRRDRRRPGSMPATTDNVAALIGTGVRYIYTHLPRLLGAGTGGFLKAAKS